MSDFYFIFYVVGPFYHNTMKQTFKYLPEGTNIIVMTPTPELIQNIKVDFNLIVLDTESLLDDFGRENESVIKDVEEEVYSKKFINNRANNIKFNLKTHRYVLPWLAERGITKFAILDADCLINFHNDLKGHLNHLEETYNSESVIFGPIMEGWSINTQDAYSLFKDLLIECDLDPKFILNLGDTITVFDSWLRGFWFHKVEHVNKYFEVWNKAVKLCHENNHPSLQTSNWVVEDIWLLGIVTEAFRHNYSMNVKDTIFGGRRLVTHIYHPENDHFSLHHEYLYQTMFNLRKADTRKEFYEINKEQLQHFYEQQNGIPRDRLKEVIYDWPY